MNKIILFIKTSNAAPPLVIYDWIGAPNGTWGTSSNWNPTGIPDADVAVANISNTNGVTSSVILSSANVSLNTLKFNSTGTNWNLSASTTNKTITFKGNNPTLTIDRIAQLTGTAGFVLQEGLTINGTANFFSTGSVGWSLPANKTIIWDNSALLSFGTAGITGATGSSFIINNGTVDPVNNATFGGPSVLMSITIRNNNAISTYRGGNSGANSTTQTITLDDVGSFPFRLIGVSTTGSNHGGLISGTISKDLIWVGYTTTSNFNGLTFTGTGKWCASNPANGTITTALNSTLANFPSSIPVALGASETTHVNNTTGSNLTIGNSTLQNNFSNNISVRPGTGTFGGTHILNGANTVNGNILLNPNNNGTAGALFRYVPTVSPATISGTISGGTNMSFQFTHATNGVLTLSGTNTYTAPTAFQGANTGGFFNVTGSCSSSAFTIGTNGIQGSGTIGALTSAAGTVRPEPLTSPSTANFLTVNGNYTSSGATIHNIRFGAANASTKLVVNGNVTLTGSVTAVAGATPVSGNTYTIIQYTGTRSGTMTTAIAGASIVNDDANKRILLVAV